MRLFQNKFSEDSGTMVSGDCGTLVQTSGIDSEAGTMIQHATLVPDNKGTLESNLGTMVINDEDEDDETMKSKFSPTLFARPEIKVGGTQLKLFLSLWSIQI
jgi:hypothetical protein